MPGVDVRVMTASSLSQGHGYDASQHCELPLTVVNLLLPAGSHVTYSKKHGRTNQQAAKLDLLTIFL